LELPVGTRFGFPIKAIQTDPGNFQDLSKFDGFRFVQKKQTENGAADDSQRWPATAMSSTNLAWGHRNHICPGRFFVVRLINLILTKLLLEYDLAWDVAPGGPRPKCVNVEGQFVPNLSQRIFIKPRSAA
jgi:aspirochlorine biosynthesis cytochrome P450 monooxygenase